ncbi:MAG: class I SAM-dependent methyltransferase [Wenzhouxiangella sp.]|nr:class I SAM-dependent methyltransferase [Wenzhouxiangella sp.]
MKNIFEIDFGQLYRKHMAACGRQVKAPEDWDARACRMRAVATDSGYVRQFVARMDLAGCQSLLDVGCGTGAISLAVADRLEQIFALDYSVGMLAAMKELAAERGIDHIHPLRRAWEDEWRDVPVCDVAIASRSTAVMDLEAALKKLDAHAAKRAYLTSKVGGYFIDPEIAGVIGRQLDPVPDYIYAVNILYQMGRQPRVDFIDNDHRPTDCETADEFVRRVSFSLGSVTDPERERLAEWFQADPDRARASGRPFRWAFIGWETA